MGLKVVILAAGKGKRMVSNLPKVLHSIGGKSMLNHVVDTANSIDAEEVFVVHGNGGDRVKQHCSHLAVTWVKQNEQLGTGHAVMQALPFCKPEDKLLVLYGDVPLISTRLLRQLTQDTLPNGIGLVVTQLDTPSGFGRIVRNELGNIVAIVEHKDASERELKINQVNTGIIHAPVSFLQANLPLLNNKNAQGEYYLTDIVSLAVKAGTPVSGVMAHDAEEVLGVNDRWQQVSLERYYQRKMAKKLLSSGARLADHNRIDIRGNLVVGADTFIDVNCLFEGEVSIGHNCVIEPNVIIKNSVIGDYVHVKANSVVDGAKIDASAVIGPFARVRPDSWIQQDAKVGNFVEIKKTIVGQGSKINHLSYVGDAALGSHVNIGAGTITCNYDGVNKFSTTIGDNAFIGSNSSLVAPLSIGRGATVGAGSTITRDALADKLVVERSTQKTIDGWKRPEKKCVTETELV